MSGTQLLSLLGYIWAAFGIYWLIASLNGKAAQTHEASYYRLARLGILAITFSLLFSRSSAVGFLDHRFVFESRAADYFAFSLALVQKQEAELSRTLRRNNIDAIALRTGDDFLPALRAFFKQRERRLAIR